MCVSYVFMGGRWLALGRGSREPLFPSLFSIKLPEGLLCARTLGISHDIGTQSSRRWQRGGMLDQLLWDLINSVWVA